VLRCGVERSGMDLLPVCTFPYLTHFPQLRELECSFCPTGSNISSSCARCGLLLSESVHSATLSRWNVQHVCGTHLQHILCCRFMGSYRPAGSSSNTPLALCCRLLPHLVHPPFVSKWNDLSGRISADSCIYELNLAVSVH
jgi:hypothetical protein